jgi:chromosome segregation ATPase
MRNRVKTVHMMDEDEQKSQVTRCGEFKRKGMNTTENHQDVTCATCLRAMLMAGAVNHLKALEDHRESVRRADERARYAMNSANEANKKARELDTELKRMSAEHAALMAALVARNEKDQWLDRRNNELWNAATSACIGTEPK